jgi:chromosome segregation ATPase
MKSPSCNQTCRNTSVLPQKFDRITLANEQERQHLQSEISTLIARAEEERSKSSKLRQAKSTLETELEQTRIEKAEAIKARDASRRELTEQRTENDSLRKQLEDSKQSRVSSMQAERIIGLEETLASTTKRLSDVKAQLDALQTKHASTEVDLEETESKAQKNTDENNLLKTRLQTLQDELEEALTVKFTRAPSQASSRAQSQQIAELTEAHEDFTAQVEAAHKKLKQVHDLRVQLEERIESLEDKLSESQVAAKRSKADLQRARDSMADTESSIQQIASLQYELAQEQSLKKSLSESVSSLQSELAVLQHTCNILRSDLASMEAASEHNATATANAAVRASRLQAEHSALIEAHETLTTR